MAKASTPNVTLGVPGEPEWYQNGTKTMLKCLPKGNPVEQMVPERSYIAPRAPDIEKPKVFLSFS